MKKFIIFSASCFILILTSPIVQSQTFLNGDFEKHSVPRGSDLINLSNADFNAKMANTKAFGSYGDMDIINSATYSGLAQNGYWFVAFTGGGTDAISMELSSPLIEGKTYTVSFWDRANTGYVPQSFQIGVSSDENSFGTIVYTAPLPVLDVWTIRKFTFKAPANGKYITVRLDGESNVGHWAHADNFAFVTPENTIITGTISGSPFCACSRLDVPFTSKGIFAPENNYTAQLSDAQGSFDDPINIGSLKSNTNSGIINCSIPCETASGSLFRIRVISSKPGIIGKDNGTDLTINSKLPPSVNISADPSNVIIEGTSVTFTAHAENGGDHPSYQWNVNGIWAGNNLSEFTSTGLKNGDVVSLMLASDAPCASSATTKSNSIIITVTTIVIPSVIISASPGTLIHQGNSVTFIATPTNGGSAPDYQWQINDVSAGGNSSTFSCSSLKDGDIVSVIMTSNLSNADPKVAISNSIMITVTEPEPVSSFVSGGKRKSSNNFKKFLFQVRKQYRKFFDNTSKNSGNQHSKRRIKHCSGF